jgi:hypothetical protein
MQPPRSMCGPNIVSLGCMLIEKRILSGKLDVYLTKNSQ